MEAIWSELFELKSKILPCFHFWAHGSPYIESRGTKVSTYADLITVDIYMYMYNNEKQLTTNTFSYM